LVKNLNETERKAVEEIVVKDPSEKWDEVARRVGISERQLRNVRNKPEVQEAVYTISKALFKTELPDVLKVVVRKAKEGTAWAAKLFFEVSGELKEQPQLGGTIEVISNVRTRPRQEEIDELTKRAEQAPEVLREQGDDNRKPQARPLTPVTH
jgi:hypothetical protein